MPAFCGGDVDGNSAGVGNLLEGEFPDMPCFTFDEAAGRFAFWGRNAELRLVSAAQMQALQE